MNRNFILYTKLFNQIVSHFKRSKKSFSDEFTEQCDVDESIYFLRTLFLGY